jgi:hypothetical protein
VRPVDNGEVRSPWLIVLRRLAVVLVATAVLVAATAVPGVLLSDRHEADRRKVEIGVQLEAVLKLTRDPEAIERMRRRLESIPPVSVSPMARRLYECLFESDEDDEDCERP